jgi:hypothetical protein
MFLIAVVYVRWQTEFFSNNSYPLHGALDAAMYRRFNSELPDHLSGD